MKTQAYLKADPSKTLGTIEERFQSSSGQWRLIVVREGSKIEANEDDFEKVFNDENVYTTCWQN